MRPTIPHTRLKPDLRLIYAWFAGTVCGSLSPDLHLIDA
jgi:hypothetical protein